jgi:hypothetical protein
MTGHPFPRPAGIEKRNETAFASLGDIFVVPELEHKLVASLCILLYSEALLFGAFAKTVIG